MMAYVTRFIYGTDKLRSNAFEVRGLNGTTTGVIHCDDLAILSQWLKYISDNVIGLTNLQVINLSIVYQSISSLCVVVATQLIICLIFIFSPSSLSLRSYSDEIV